MFGNPGSKLASPLRAEQQRNQALQNAEKLKEAFNDYKDTFSIKLRKVHFHSKLSSYFMTTKNLFLPVDAGDVLSFCTFEVVESETTLKESLMGSDREKQELEVKFSALERERAEQSQTVRY